MIGRRRMSSVFAFEDIRNSGKEYTWRIRCLDYLKNHEATDGEAMKALGVQDPNCYRPERTRLSQEGLVVSVDRRKCKITGKLCVVWTASRNVSR